MEIQQPKKPATRTKVSFLFERANILSKSQLITIAQKLREGQLLETNLVQIRNKLATFWDKGGTISPHVTYPPLGHLLEVLFVIFCSLGNFDNIISVFCERSIKSGTKLTATKSKTRQ